MFRRSSLAVAAAMLSISHAANAGLSRLLAPVTTRMSDGPVPVGSYSYPRHGATMAQQKRAAKKARNVKRHRAACRG